MKGCVTKRGKTWAFVIEVGKHPVTGRRKQKWQSGFATSEEAEAALAKALVTLNQSTNAGESSSTKETVAAYMESWLKQKKAQVRPGTYKSYNWIVNKYIIPQLGHHPLDKLNPMQLQNFILELQQDTKLSNRSINHIRTVLHNALESACKFELVTKNVAKPITAPKVNKVHVKVWDEQQLKTFLTEAKRTRYYIAFLLAATTGMRLGEVIGVKWEDVDFNRQTLSVKRSYTRAHSGYQFNEPKTATGNRVIALPKAVLEELEAHRVTQEAEKSKEGYNDHGLVTQTTNGTPVSPRNLYRLWASIVKRAGLPRIRFHDLRHTHASLLLKQGVHPKVVAERLGHSNIQLTLNTYSHLLPNMQEEAAAKFGEFLT
ncbi:site-specific integrase [Calidifontibacillus oryziterrae]|uniref:site-specific integrase n=1 Tax=Calidifontibacillus oryziterrae TaxID=1191699 RepID=UPI000314A06B|nr:site-specific integrase [Calidifontibacillus oryziterrae]